MRKQQKDTQLETCQQAASCEKLPEPSLTKAKIIPFPGVLLSKLDCFQNEVDIFLREMRYVD